MLSHALPWLMRLPLLLLLVHLTACTTLGPDYQEPKAAWLDEWRTNLYGMVSSPQDEADQDLRFWWQTFNDPTLNQLIETVRRENPSLHITALRILESRAQLGIADSSRYPQLQQLGGAVTYINSRDQGGALANDTQSLTSYQIGFNLGWELDFWGKYRRAIESADAAYFAAITNQHDAQVLMVAQTADLYFTYRTTQLRINIAYKNAKTQKRSLEITEQLFEKGQGSELDLQQAKAQYLATLSAIPDLEIALTKTRNALATLLARPPGELPELDASEPQLPKIDDLVIRAIPSRLLLKRPDVRTAAWQVAAQSAQIGIAEADFYPSINLLGSIGWSGNTLNGSPNNTLLSLGPALTWNLFDHGRLRNSVRVQDVRLQQLIEQYQNTVLQAAQEIDSSAYSLIKTKQKQQLLHDSLIAAERSLELATIRYREGYSGFQRVLDAQRSVASQADRELANQGSQLSALIALYKALGGGWLETASIDQLIPASVRDTMQERSDWGSLMSEPLPTRLPPATETPTHE